VDPGEVPVTRLLLTLAFATALVAVPSSSRAHDAYDDSEANPLRLAAYALHPVGWALEWTVMRPIHFLVSNPRLEPIFGHVPHESPWGGYEWYPQSQPDDTR
jgi:hypothetical protein